MLKVSSLVILTLHCLAVLYDITVGYILSVISVVTMLYQCLSMSWVSILQLEFFDEHK